MKIRGEHDEVMRWQRLIRAPEFDPLPREQEVAYGELARAGDVDARDRLIQSQLRWAFQIAMKKKSWPMPAMDRIQSANHGACIAVEKWDPGRGIKLATVAFWWIRQQLWWDAKHNYASIMRFPQQGMSVLRDWERAELRLIQRLERAPMPAEIALESGIPAETAQVMHAALHGVLLESDHFAHAHSSGQDENFLFDTIITEAILDQRPDRPFEDEFESRDLLFGIYRKMKSERQKDVLLRRKAEEQTLEEVGKVYGFTRERARQIEEKGLANARRLVENLR